MAINLAPAQQLDEQRRRDLINSLSLQQHPLAAGPGDRELQQRRAQLDQSFANARSLLQPMAAGQAGPFTPAVQQGLFAGAADAAAGQQRAARGAINQTFARQGLVGSGGALQAQLDAQRQIGKGLQQQRTQIGVTSALENERAKASAIQQLLQLLGQETAYQSQFNVVSDAGGGALERALAGMLSGGGGGGGVGGGLSLGGGAGAAAAAVPSWNDIWAQQNAADEAAAAAIRADNAARAAALASQSRVQPSGGIGSGSGLAGLLGLAAGTVAAGTVGGAGPAGTGRLSGSNGSYQGTPEQMLAAVRAARDGPKLDFSPAYSARGTNMARGGF